MKKLVVIIGFVSVILFSGCSSKVEIVLLPQDDGSVGEIVVYDDSKEVVLDKPWQKVDTSNLEKKEVLSKEVVEAEYKSLIAAMPKELKSYRFYFKFGSSEMVGESIAKFNNVIKLIESDGILEIDVIGYTDRAGDDAYNRILSLKRAKKIVNMLKSKGVDEKIISLKYYGEANPVVPTADGVPKKVNRRVEVTLK